MKHKTIYIILAIIGIALAATILFHLLIILSGLILIVIVPLVIVFLLLLLFSKSFNKSRKIKKLKKTLEYLGKNIFDMIRNLFR